MQHFFFGDSLKECLHTELLVKFVSVSLSLKEGTLTNQEVFSHWTGFYRRIIQIQSSTETQNTKLLFKKTAAEFKQ